MTDARRIVMIAALKPSALITVGTSFIQKIDTSDLSQIGELMYDSFLGTIDYEGESEEDAKSEVVALFQGKYGAIIPDACLCIKENGTIISAVFFTWHESKLMPLLTFTMTRSSFKGRGYAKMLLKAGLNELIRAGQTQCCLVVTRGNESAIKIYKYFGFTEEISL